MLVEGGDGLFAPIFEDMKPAAFQAMHGFVMVGDHHIHEDEICVGMENGRRRGGFGIRWGNGGGLRGRRLRCCADR